MERKFYMTGYGLKAQIAACEDGTFCVTRYSYNDMIMQNAVVAQHVCDSFDDALAVLDRMYGKSIAEVDEATFLRSFEIDHSEVFSLNDGYAIPLKSVRDGWTQGIIIRIGRKQYYVDIDKDAHSAFVQMYPYAKDRASFSKYAGGCSSVSCKPDAILTREFFDHIAEIEKAQSVLRHFGSVVM